MTSDEILLLNITDIKPLLKHKENSYRLQWEQTRAIAYAAQFCMGNPDKVSQTKYMPLPWDNEFNSRPSLQQFLEINGKYTEEIDERGKLVTIER